MKKIIKSISARVVLTQAVMLCCLTGARAEELTVYNETDGITEIPVYGYYADTPGTASEFVIPSDELINMAGGTITGLKFYLSSPAEAAWGATIQVYLKEIAGTTLSSFTGPGACTVVYTGTLDATGTVMTVTFITPYIYTGGNLLIGTYVSEAGDCKSATFCGCNQLNNTAWYRVSESGVGSSRRFIPKTTFTYTPDNDKKPSALNLDEVGSSTATLSWTAPTGGGTVTGYTYQYKKITEENWSTEVTVNNTSVTLNGLTAGTAYRFRVKAVYEDDESYYISTTFLTDCGVITTFPWTEDFEGYVSDGKLEAYCWQNDHISGSGTEYFEVFSSTTGSNSTHQLRLHDMASGTKTKLRLPVMTLPDNNYMFVLDVYRNSNYSSETAEGIRVYASANGEIEGATELAFIPRVRSVSNSVIPAESVDGWYTYKLPIPMSGTCYIILRGESQNGASTYMDNFAVKVAPPKLTVSDVTATTANATWTACDGVTSYTIQLASNDQFATGGAGSSVTLFSNDGTDANSAPTGWTYNVSDKASAYLLMFSGHSVVSEAMDASAYTDLSVSLYIRTHGGTSQPNLTIQYSTDNGSTWTDAGTVAGASSTMAQRTLALPAAAASSALRLRFAPTTTSSSVGVGIKSIVLTGTQPASLINEYSVTDGTSYTFNDLTPGTTYYVRVKGDDDWSNVEEFTTSAVGTGTQDDPYVISSVDDWDTFANPDNAETYWGSNVYVRLGADIPTADDIAASKSITTMVGTSDYKYQGTFDGCGHTLTVNLTHSSGGDAWVAPFKCIYGATIKQLHTAGTITTNGKMAGGIVGDSWGESSIQSCQSSVTINTSVDGDGTHGGLVGRMNDGKLTITDCLFDGSIIGSSTTNCGGFVGWREGTTLNITNCLMAGTFDINVDNNSATFSRNGVSSISNSYYTTALGTAQGVQVFTTAPESEITKLQTLIDGNNYYVPCTITGINTSYLYTGETITVTPTVKDADGNTLTKDTHYTIAFTKGGNTVNEVKELGTYTITITAITSGGYTGEKTFTFMVKNELTVYDGTNTNSYIPVCGDFAYNEGTVSEFVIPSGQLTAMVGGTISDLKFYLSSPASEAWTGKFKVYLKEIAEPTLTGITGPDDDGCTVVYTGTLDATGTVMTVTFDDSYTYNGGNLLIGSYIDEGGDFGSAYFYGVEQNENTAWYDIPYEFGDAQQFIPKTTFTYIPDKDMPSALTLDEVDASSATLSWTAPTGERTLTGYTYQYKKTTEENWSDEETVTTTSVALSGLIAATAYDFRVKANYSDDGESRYISITFLTDCEAITTFPWTEDFENISASVGGRLNEPCWQNEHISGNGSYFFEVYSSTTGSNSTKQLCLPDMSSGTMTKLRLPVMNLPDNSHYLFALDVYRSSSSNMIDEGIRVFASTDGKIEGAQEMAFIPRVRSVGNSIIPTESADGWYTYDLLIPMSGTCYIILRGESQNGTSTYMDNFEVKVAPSCISPIGLIASNVTSTSATLSWTERGSASAWVLQYGTDENFTAGTYTETTVENNPTTNLTELTPESIYYARVKPECDTEGYNWSIPVTFEPTAKVTIGSGTNNSEYVPINNSYSYSLTQQIYTVAELGGAGLIESIDFYKNSTYFCRRKIDIYMVNTSKSSFESTSDWIPVTDADLVFSGAVTFADNDWTSITLDNPFIYDGTQNVAIIVDDNSGFFEFDTSNFLTYPVSEYQSLYYCKRLSNASDIDPSNPSAEDKGRISNKNQIRILKSPFGMPENFMATKVGPTQATLTWVETGAATKWVVAYKKTGDATFTEVHATTNSYTLTGLSNETAYTVKVRPANNDDLWSSEITFTTTVDNPVPTDVAVSDISHTSATVNWTGFGESYNVRYRMHAILEEGFENGLGSWTMQNQDSRTGVNWRAANHGSNGFMFYYNSNPPQYLISPEMTKECTLLEFYYKNFSINYQETFHVGFSSTTNSTDAFTFGDVITAADAQWHLCQVPIPAGTKYICWKLTSNDQYCLCIDDIVVSVTTDWTNTNVTEESLSLEGLTAGITYHCQVQSVKDGETTDWSPVTEFTTPLAVGTLTEAEGVTYLTTNASGQNDVPVEFSRSFTMNVASTICLPFPMTRITGGKVYQFVGVEYDNTDGWMATMSDATPDNKVTSTVANKPYLFMPTKTGNVTFRGTIASVPAEITADYSTSGDWTFRGTYSRLEYGTDPFSGKAFGFAASSGENGVVAGEFVRAVEGASIRAFRAFLIYSGADPDLQARATRGGTGIPDRITVRLIGKDGEIDGIGEISLSTGEVTFDPNAWYDLSGRRLDGKPTKKGVYINNGRKIAIK